MKKKIKFLTIFVAILCLIPTIAFAKEKVNVYMFRGEGCGYCARAIAYFRTLQEDEDYKDKFNVVTYEVWNDANNSKLMAAVADELGKTVNGVPFIIIGSKTFNGYAANYNEDIEKAIDDNYDSKSYSDVVAKVIKDNDYEEKATVTTLDDIKETTTEESSNNTSTSNSKTESEEKSNTGIIIGICCVFIGGLGALIFVSRS